jgi:hypothetical protein
MIKVNIKLKEYSSFVGIKFYVQGQNGETIYLIIRSDKSRKYKVKNLYTHKIYSLTFSDKDVIGMFETGKWVIV